MQYLNNFFNIVLNCGVNPEDNMDVKLKKQTLMLMLIIIGVTAAIWGSVFFLLEHRLSGSIPLSYSVISALSLIYVNYSKNMKFLLVSQLTLVLLLPFLLMWSLGGFASGSYVMIWAFYAPLAAMAYSKKDVNIWIILFILLTAISAVTDHSFETSVEPLPETVIHVFYFLNIVAGFGGIFLLSITILKKKTILLLN